MTRNDRQTARADRCAEAPLSRRPPDAAPTDGRRMRRIQTRGSVLDAALQLASREGLEGLSMARVAERLGGAKSTIHATFGSKQALQLAVLGRARDVLIEVVVAPAMSHRAGVDRLCALGESWMRYLDNDTFEGGCILSAASTELDGRPGPARDAVASIMREWLELLARETRSGLRAGELNEATDPDQLAFDLNAIGMAANWHHQLFSDGTALNHGRTAWKATIERHRGRPG